jgi:hypothetical protein
MSVLNNSWIGHTLLSLKEKKEEEIRRRAIC